MLREIEIKRNEIITLLKTLKKLEFYYQKNFNEISVKELFNLVRTIRILTKYVEEINTVIETTQSIIKEYDNKRIEICLKYCKKDQDGNPIIVNNNYTIDDTEKVDFDNEIKQLTSQYQNNLNDYKIKLKELQELLNEKIIIRVPLLSINILPNNQDKEKRFYLDTNELSVLDILIEES